jgi:hypothetical protein
MALHERITHRSKQTSHNPTAPLKHATASTTEQRKTTGMAPAIPTSTDLIRVSHDPTCGLPRGPKGVLASRLSTVDPRPSTLAS